jgi:SARP family transcriptional regulator, regulator of embCAB operon
MNSSSSVPRADQPQSHTICFSMVDNVTPSRLRSGCDRVASAPRIHLVGELSIEADDRLLHERQLPGPLARHFVAFLAAHHRRFVGSGEIADELWNGAPPPAWPTSLKVLASRTRTALSAAGLSGPALLAGAPGVYRCRLPADGWVDIDAARAAVHHAEELLARGAFRPAAGEAFVARLITARTLLAGRTGPWVTRCRRELVDICLRSVECCAAVHIACNRPASAARDAQRAIELAPLREPSWRLLMDAHAAAGDVASALDTYARCCTTIIEALGVGPSPATRARHAELLALAG